MLLLEVKIVLN